MDDRVYIKAKGNISGEYFIIIFIRRMINHLDMLESNARGCKPKTRGNLSPK